MALSDIKNLVKQRAKVTCISDDLHNALTATDEQTLIDIILTMPEWLYQSGLLDGELLALFTEAKLNSNSIYISDGTITPSSGTVYIMAGATVTISLNATDKVNVVLMGSSTANITMIENSFVDISLHDQCAINLTMTDDAIATVESRDRSNVKANVSEDAMVNVDGRGHSLIELSLDDDSCGIVTLEQKASLIYTLLDNGSVEVNNNNKNNVVVLEPEV